ncbi:MAG: hypothetical protein HQL93_13120 [Magnetococcales bacterium]|nr:hypothetical protein [Magnetococcales bacterium]
MTNWRQWRGTNGGNKGEATRYPVYKTAGETIQKSAWQTGWLRMRTEQAFDLSPHTTPGKFVSPPMLPSVQSPAVCTVKG